MKVIEIYEYGNGDYAKPFWDRVQEKIDKIEESKDMFENVTKF